GSDADRRRLEPWFAISAAAFVFAVAGVVVETTTVQMKFLISRTSMFMMLAAMPIVCVGLDVIARRIDGRTAARTAVALMILFFLGQSNVPSIYRFLRDSRAQRTERRQFLAAAERVKALTPRDAVIAAPSPEENDLAASLRTYATRASYVTYKDGGISLVDGERARRWLTRYRTL